MAPHTHRKLHTKVNSHAEEDTTSIRQTSRGLQADRAEGDAGVELAEDFGRDFLIVATSGADLGEVEDVSSAEASEFGETFLHVTDELEDLTADAEPADDD